MSMTPPNLHLPGHRAPVAIERLSWAGSQSLGPGGTSYIMNIPQQIIRFGILALLCCLVGCATDPMAEVTSKRTIAEVEPKVRAGMPLSELLSFTKNTPIMTAGYNRLKLADGDLWVTEGRDEHGTVTVKDWRIQKR